MKKILAGLIFLIFGALIVPNVSAQTYENSKYGFIINFPQGWDIDDYPIFYDPNPGYDEGSVSFVAAYDDANYWDQYIEVGFIKKDLILRNYQGQDYLNRFEITLAEYCQTATMELDGYTCNNYKTVDSKITQIDGRTAYIVTESWIEDYGDGTTYEMAGISVDIPIEDNVWTIVHTGSQEEYDSIKNQIIDSVESFRFIGEPKEPVLEVPENTFSDMIPFVEPIGSHYINSDVGFEIQFPEDRQGIRMQFPEELFEDLDTEFGDFQHGDEFEQQIVDFLAKSVIIMSIPQDTMMENPQSVNMDLIMILENSSINNLTDTFSQMASVSSSPESLYGSFEESDSDCDFGDMRIVEINKIKSYEMTATCDVPETNQTMDMILYMFGTNEHFILTMSLVLGDGQNVDFAQFEKTMDTLKINNTLDLSDPYSYSKPFDWMVDTKTVHHNEQTYDIVIVSNKIVSGFDLKQGQIEMIFDHTDADYVYFDVFVNDMLKGPFSAIINGEELEVMEIRDTTNGNRILSLQYIGEPDKVSIIDEGMKIPLPNWIRTNAEWWVAGQIDDQTFVQGIEYMVNEDIIKISSDIKKSESVSDEIPKWIKNNVDWWSQNLLSDEEFVKGIQHMVESGIISIE